MGHMAEFIKGYICEAPPFLPEHLQKRLHFLSCLSEKETRSVFLVQDKESGEKRILKITDNRSPDSAKSEYKILSGLNHPGIPRCILFEEDAMGREYILRSYMEGDSLDFLLDRDGAFDEAQIFDIILKVCVILRYLHKQQPPIIYRDINPSNITLTANGKISLLDFGISKKIQEGTSKKSPHTVFVGTIPFIAPEQMGFDKTDHRSDIFALGKLMLYLYTGQIDAAVDAVDKKDARIGKLIEKCTRQSKERRFSSIRQVERAILWAQKKPVKHAFLKGAALTCAIAFAFLALFYHVYAGKIQTSFPAQAVINIGAVDENLPLRSPELIAAVRQALIISDDTPLTEDMLANVTTIEIRAENNDDNETVIGISKPVLPDDFLAELKYFKNLTHLSINGFQIGSLTPLGDVYLQTLCLTNCGAANISALRKMTSLKTLNLSDNPIEDIHALAGLDKLQSLNLSYTYVRDISALEKLSGLKELNLCAMRATDLSPLGRLTGLETLQISHVQINDFLFLENLISLKQLELRSTGFRDLAMITSTRLEALDISLNYNYLTDISGLGEFPALRNLDISLNEIEDYSPLYDLTNLQTLGIHENQAERFLLSEQQLALMPNLNKILLTANELNETWQKLAEQGKVNVVLRSYYETY